jgi:hypothetical protein
LVQFGKSGLGKTSLLQAGLFPRLRQKPFLPVMVRLNIADDTFTLAVADSIQQACKTEGLQLTEDRKDGLWELLSTTTVWRDDLLLTPVLVFDQFEEVFTLRDAAFRADLAAELGALASGIAPERLCSGGAGVPEQFAARPDVKVVISLREDYLGALQEFSAAIPSLFHERLRLELLTEKAAREGITGPAQLASAAGAEPYWAPHFDFEPSALDSMIAYLKGSSGIIEPFQLQLLCRHAEAIACARGSTQNDLVQLTLADFSGSKDFNSVLKNFYRDTLLKLDSSQRKRAEELCEEGLLNVSGHRLMLEEGQILRHFRITLNTLNTLSQERLVRREHRNESFFYEISHDRLSESILQSKRFRLPKKVRRALWTTGIVAPVIVAGLLFWAHSLWLETRPWGYIKNLATGSVHPATEDVVSLGRSTEGYFQNRINLKPNAVSRLHALISRDLKVLDMRSLVGTTVNGNFLPYGEAAPLKDGDILVLGGIAPFEFEITEYSSLPFWTPAAKRRPAPRGWGVVMDGKARAVHYLTDAEDFLTMDAGGRLQISTRDNGGALMTIKKIETELGWSLPVIVDRQDDTELWAAMKDGDYTYVTCRLPSGRALAEITRNDRGDCKYLLRRYDRPPENKTENDYVYSVSFWYGDVSFQIVPILADLEWPAAERR